MLCASLLGSLSMLLQRINKMGKFFSFFLRILEVVFVLILQTITCHKRLRRQRGQQFGEQENDVRLQTYKSFKDDIWPFSIQNSFVLLAMVKRKMFPWQIEKTRKDAEPTDRCRFFHSSKWKTDTEFKPTDSSPLAGSTMSLT